MCGRYLLYTPVATLVRAFGLDPDLRPNLEPRYNLAPTQEVAIVRRAEGTRRLDRARWGLIPSWAKDPSIASRLINARSETAPEKPAFRSAFKSRRCLVPADGFYEWVKDGKAKQPWLLEPAAGGPIAFAGLFEHWHQPDGVELRTMTILTTDASADIRHLHDRMPVILGSDAYDAWLEAPPPVAHALCRPAPEGLLRCRPVDCRVNAVRNDDASLIAAVPAPAALL